MKKPKQLKLFKFHDPAAYGGKTKGKRKIARPFARNKSIHVVMRASVARGPLSLRTYKNSEIVEKTLKECAKKFGVGIEEWVNAKNHLHLKLRGSERKNFGRFLRTFSALVARRVTGAKKGKSFGKFWDGLVYTRVIKSWTEQKILWRYFHANELEAQFGRMARDLFLGHATWEDLEALGTG